MSKAKSLKRLAELKSNNVPITFVGGKKVVASWNGFRKNGTIPLDLDGASFRDEYFNKANFSGLHLDQANFSNSILQEANFSGSHLYRANFAEADLRNADLSGALLLETDLSYANLTGASLAGATLDNTSLECATLVDVDLSGAVINECCVYGLSAWNLSLATTVQQNLIITPEDEPDIVVDDLEIAQFLYLLLNSQSLRRAIDTITSKVVLILGRFSGDRKAVLDVVRSLLRNRGYVPVLFDFEAPRNRDLTETISLFAHLARFVVADITDPRSLPQELMRIVPSMPSVPVQPLLLSREEPWGMFEHFQRYPWVLQPLLYEDIDALIACFDEGVVRAAESFYANRSANQSKRPTAFST
jgi:uncharacterized protein YjbI with pentapeptide repeats